jgi:hypothetical protein
MRKTVLIGHGREMTEISCEDWENGLARAPARFQERLKFMSTEHHLVRNFVVRELPIAVKPLSAEFIAARLNLSLSRVQEILDELEKNLTFIFRNDQGDVLWAYPVTAAPTPNQITFDTGEELYAAWAIDAMASPFVQGQLRKKPVSITVKTQCAHCAEPMRLKINSDLVCEILAGGAEPLLFVPQVDFSKLTDPSIIDAFWRKSVFFWSEEHARAYRADHDQISGLYYTLEQASHHTRIVQSVLFAFWIK